MITSLTLFGNKALRTAIERNQVSFPAQIPVFAKHQAGDIQARVVQLYFIAGWTIRDIGKRYNMTTDVVRKSLTEWRIRAISSGYIQELGPEVLPTPESFTDRPSSDAREGEAQEDAEEESADRSASGEQARTPFQVVSFGVQATPQQGVSYAGAGEEVRINILHMVLEDLEAELGAGREAGAGRPSRWQPVCLRLLQILKQECIQSGLTLSTAQAERIEAIMEIRPEQAGDLLRDLRNRIADEERCTAVLGNIGPGRTGILQVFLSEIETLVRERDRGFGDNESDWPGHCHHFLAAIKQGCSELGMEFSLAQVKRIESALTGDPHRLGDLLRDLRNRLSDEQEHTSLVSVPDRTPRQMKAGSIR